MRGKQAINFVKLKRTLRTKFVNAVLVNVYNNYCLCINQYFSRYFENKAYNFFEQHSLLCSSKFFIFLAPPDTCNSQVDFSNDGSSQPDRTITIRQDIRSCLRQFEFWK